MMANTCQLATSQMVFARLIGHPLVAQRPVLEGAGYQCIHKIVAKQRRLLIPG